MNDIDDIVAKSLRDHPVAPTLDALSVTSRAQLERAATRAGTSPADYLERARAEHTAYLAKLDASSAAKALALEIRRG